MNKIPFSIDKRPEIEAGKYQVVFNDKPARIICWDKKSINLGRHVEGGDMIVALVDDGNSEHTEYFYEDGNSICVISPSLFLVPAEPELTEFEKAVSDVVEMAWLGGKDNPYEFTKEEYAKIKSLELLSLARKELQPEIDAEVEKAYKNADRMQYEKGKEDALKDLPRWKKCGEDTGQTILYKGFCKGQNYLEMDGYRIMLSDLKKLPKEEEQ